METARSFPDFMLLLGVATGIGAIIVWRSERLGWRPAVLFLFALLVAWWAINEAWVIAEEPVDALAAVVATTLALASVLLVISALFAALLLFGLLRERWLAYTVAMMVAGFSPVFLWALFRSLSPAMFLLGE